VIVDFADRHHPTLAAHAVERCTTYCGEGIFDVRVLAHAAEFTPFLDMALGPG
jgi:hypothetical protein